MTTEEYGKTLVSLSTLSAALRMMPLEDFIDTIETAESMKALHKPTEQQAKNLADIKCVAQAALELKKVILEIAGESKGKPASRIILPGTLQ